ncbi:Ty-mediated expression protein [Diplodia intermedia]|uniref:Ty-mediated expression protein n=1 Tax=Diplodia intermedia TaxID=856260 RepID=A0ABR3TQ87_9PEZI
MDRTPNPDDQWFPDDWHHHSFPALPLANSHGFDIDFRWGSTWLDDQGVAAETASPDVPMTNWQSLQEPDHGGGGGGGGGGSNSGGGRNTQPALPAHKIEVSLTSPSARVPHKAVEKKYREGIKAMFRRLGAAIPGVPNTPPYGTNTYADAADSDNNSSMPMPAFLQHEGVGGSEGVARPPQRPTKAGIISRAIEYIHRLEGEVAEERARREGAEAEAEGLRAEVVALRREVGLWRVGADMFEAYGEGAGEGLG